MKKQAFIGGALASHIGQNLIGKPIANSKWFNRDVVKSGIMGALGKKAPRSAGGYAKDAFMGVVAPEVNIMKNTAYQAGRDKAKELHNKIRKMPEYKAARARQKAIGGKLDLPTAVRRKLVEARREVLKGGNVSKRDYKDIQKLPSGNRAPSSNKAAVAANIALSAVPGGTGTAVVNAAKLGSGTKAFNNSVLGKKINETFVTNPIKKQFSRGVDKVPFDKVRNTIESYTINPFTAAAEMKAHKLGAKHSSNIKKTNQWRTL